MQSTVQLIDLLGAAALLLWGLRLIKTGLLRGYGAVLRRWLSRGADNRFLAAFWGFLATLCLQSSTASAVIIASFTARDIVRPRMAQAMMLGANLGTAIVTLVLSADVHWVGSAAIFMGVLLFSITSGNRTRNLGRALLGLGLMLLAGPIAAWLQELLTNPQHLVVGAHVAFNSLLLVVFLPLVGPLCRLAERLLLAPAEPASNRSQLDESLLPMPEMALAVAARETLRLGDLVDEMLERTLAALDSPEEAGFAELARLEAQVDQRHEAVKLYVARLSRNPLDEDDARRAAEILSYAINLEHIGDIVEGGIAEIAAKKARNRLSLSAEGQAEITAFFRHTLENLRMAQAIFLSRDASLARRLVARKVESRRIEAESAERHLNRMRTGRVETLETSAIHLDILRDLKRVNAHIASVSYPILEELGLLEESRLKEGLVPVPRV